MTPESEIKRLMDSFSNTGGVAVITENAAIKQVAIFPTPVCDFCLSPAGQWLYPATDIVCTHAEDGWPGFTSYGEWLACDVCHTFIEANDHLGLLDYSYREAQQRGGDGNRNRCAQIQWGFWTARTGPGVPWVNQPRHAIT